jgi:hypothetical protein
MVYQSLVLIICRVGLPKKTETFFFFVINEAKATDFRRQLKQLLPSITSCKQASGDRSELAKHKKSKTAPGKHTVPSKKDDPELLKLVGVNIAFSFTGLEKVSRSSPN